MYMKRQSEFFPIFKKNVSRVAYGKAFRRKNEKILSLLGKIRGVLKRRATANRLNLRLSARSHGFFRYASA